MFYLYGLWSRTLQITYSHPRSSMYDRVYFSFLFDFCLRTASSIPSLDFILNCNSYFDPHSISMCLVISEWYFNHHARISYYILSLSATNERSKTSVRESCLVCNQCEFNMYIYLWAVMMMMM